MPMSMTKEKTRSGHDYVRMHSTGVVSADDAKELSVKMGPGKAFGNLPILALVDRGTEYSPEARQQFTQFGNGNEAERHPIAIVVQSAPMRVMLSFIIRITGNAAHTRFFSAEPDALAWLEETLLAKAS